MDTWKRINPKAMKSSLTRIKRELAIFGIGDPLSQLFYTSKEFEEMRKMGLLLPKTTTEQEENEALFWGRFFYELSLGNPCSNGHYAIKTGKITTKQRFSTMKLAVAWATWNYKGNYGWEVIKINPLTNK